MHNKNMEENYELVLFNDKDEMEIVSVKIRFADKDAWLTLEQIAMIYQVTQEKVLMHISNIYTDGELDREKTCKKYLVTLQDGDTRYKEKWTIIIWT